MICIFIIFISKIFHTQIQQNWNIKVILTTYYSIQITSIKIIISKFTYNLMSPSNLLHWTENFVKEYKCHNYLECKYNKKSSHLISPSSAMKFHLTLFSFPFLLFTFGVFVIICFPLCLSFGLVTSQLDQLETLNDFLAQYSRAQPSPAQPIKLSNTLKKLKVPSEMKPPRGRKFRIQGKRI